MARPQELRARRDVMDAEAKFDRLRDVIWKLEKQLDEVGKMSNRRGELLKEALSILYSMSNARACWPETVEAIEKELADE